MTLAQQQLVDRARQRIGRLRPDVAAAVLRAFAFVIASLDDGQLRTLVAAGAVERIISAVLSDAILNRAVLPIRAALRSTIATAFRWNVPYLPRGGQLVPAAPIDGTATVLFDHLNPRVIDAITNLESRVVDGFKADVRDSVRQAIARGLETRASSASIAQEIRNVVRLSAPQEAAVANFRALLEAGDREALTRLLRDQRFDATLERALGTKGTGLSAERIDAMTAAYRRKAIAYHANTITTTATKDAYKIAQRESWAAAIDAGIVDGRTLRKEWVHLAGQEHPRLHHQAMNGQSVPFDQPYSNGDTYAGEQDPWNCHCLDRVFVARAA